MDDLPCTLEEFIALSECLTGVAGLDSDLAAQYLRRFCDHPTSGRALPGLCREVGRIVEEATGEAALEADVGARIMNDPELGPAAQQLIYLWYVGAFFEADPADPRRGAWRYGSDPDHYGRGLMWAVIRAHAPMTPGTDEDQRQGPPDQAPEPYWTTRPNLDAPVAVPPAWFDRS